MFSMSRLQKAGLAVLLVGGVLAFALPSAAVEPSATAGTLDNLMAAFNGESNAHARYLAFAKKADEEGYAGVASLFRAAAKAEEVHANRHASVIRALGGTPQAAIEAPDVKSTRENLMAAVAGETYERDTMYPGFLKQARQEGIRDAVKAFNFAKTAEAEHAKLYQNALDNLESMRTAKTFYVCTVCGYTTNAITFKKCPSCFTKVEDYVTVK